MKRILIRFDDICPTMDWKQWGRATELMDKYNIKPLIGVIPECQDPGLKINAPRVDFWDYIKELQNKGYTIAMHGYLHVYDIKKRGIINKGYNSEFAGHPYELQLEKISNGRDILLANGIKTNIFFAPSHSYDYNTLKALRKCGFRYVSDGKSTKPIEREGIICIPSRDWGAKSLIPQNYETKVFHAHEWANPKNLYEYNAFIDICTNMTKSICTFDEYIKREIGNYYIQSFDEFLYLLWDRYVYDGLRKNVNKILRR